MPSGFRRCHFRGMFARVRYALVVVVLAACGKSKDECRVEARAAGDLLVAAARELPMWFEPPDDLPLVTRTDLPARRDLRSGAVVIVTPTQLQIPERWGSSGKLAAQTVTDPAALVDALRVEQEELQAAAERYPRGAPDTRRVYLMIDPTVPWERVVAVVGAANTAGLSAPAFVFEQPSTITPPPRAGIDAKLDAIMKGDPAERATQAAKLMSDVVKDCAPLVKSFGAVAGDDGGDKGMSLARDITAALVACNCEVNIPDLRSAMFRILHVKRPLRVITFDPDALPARITLPPTTTWAEASKRLTLVVKNATFGL
jgi:hypothetical protein